MINNIDKPKISKDFTLDDIEKIREWNYERLKDATPEEQLADIHHRGEIAIKKFELWKTDATSHNRVFP
jgi:hypothetical protein